MYLNCFKYGIARKPRVFPVIDGFATEIKQK